MDKIQQQTDLIAAEKDTKVEWIGRYEREQKAHIETHTALLEQSAQMQEATVKFENQRTLAESLESIKQSLTESHEEMQKQLAQAEADKERLKRTIQTKNQLKVAQEESHRHHVETLRAEHGLVVEDYKRIVGETQMEQEELRSITQRHFEEQQRLKQVAEGLSEELEEARAEIDRLSKLLKDRE